MTLDRVKRIVVVAVIAFVGNLVSSELARSLVCAADDIAGTYSAKEDSEEVRTGVLGTLAKKVGDRLTVDAGVKFWIARWQTRASLRGALATTATSDITTLIGPTVTGRLKLRDHDFFHTLSVNFNYLVAGGFDFSPIGTTESGAPLDKTSATRSDYSIVAILSVWRGFGIFGGYYNMTQKFTTVDLVNSGEPQLKTNASISGPIIGIYGTGTVVDRLRAYGNLAIGFFDYEVQGDSSGSTEGYAGELGLSYDGPSLKTPLGAIDSSIQAGWRAQIIHTRFTVTQANDVTWGPTLALLLRF